MLKHISGVMAAIVLIASVAVAAVSMMGKKPDKLYQNLRQTASGVPDITEVFSFTCPHCYRFSEQWHISAEIKSYAKKRFSYEKYHVSIGPLGHILSEAWAVAVVKKIEDDIAPALFRGVQITHEIKSESDILRVFEKFGINQERFHHILKQEDAQAFMQRQRAAAVSLNVQGVPGVYITGDKLLRTDRILKHKEESSRYSAAYVQAIDDILHNRNNYQDYD